jgi:hypothetical protein
LLKVRLLEDVVSGLVQTKGGARSAFQPSMKARILPFSSFTDRSVPRRMAWRLMIPNQTSTRFSHDPEVGVKWTVIRLFAASQSRTSTRLCAA